MKQLIFALLSLIIICSTITAEKIKLDEFTLANLRRFGIEINDISFFAEIESDEFKDYNTLTIDDKNDQAEFVYIWSTIQRGYVDKLDIQTASSSTLNGYPLKNLFDKRMNTAWVEGVYGDGFGEWVSLDIHTVKHESPSIITLFGIVPGYLKSEKTWNENNRIKTILLIIKTASIDYFNNEPSSEYAVLRLKLKDYKGVQVFRVSNFQNHATFDKKIWIIIDEVYKGSKYSDTCISEIYIRGGCLPPSP